MTTDVQVTDNPSRSRFEAQVEGRLAVAEYRLQGEGVMAMTHTEVPPELEGRGIAAALVRAAVAHARENGLKLRPLCAYVAAYARKHPEIADVLAAA